jgi:hyperosmotically inducible protein
MRNKILFAIVAAIAMLNFSANSALAQSYLDMEELSSQGSSRPLNDAIIATKIRAELTIAEDIKSGDIDVEVIDGVVFLIGTQPSETLVKKAEAIAMSIKNVKGVNATRLIVKIPEVD